MPVPDHYDDLFYPSADGRLTLYARHYAGEGPPLVLMHGLTRNSADFEGLAHHLAGRFRLVVPDQRGRGRSQYDNDARNYSPATYCADMMGLIDHLGLDRPVLVGTSMGGVMAMVMGAMHPGRFRGVIINDIGPEVDPSGIARIATYVGMEVVVGSWPEAAAYCRTISGNAFPTYDDQDWLRSAKRMFTAVDGGKLRLAYDPAIAEAFKADDGAAPAPDLWPMWDALASSRVLILRGELSDILTAETMDRMHARHPGIHMVTVPAVGHAPMLDEPEALAAIDSFLEAGA